METLLVGPFLIFVIVFAFQVKKRGRQWTDILLGVYGGLVLAAMFTGLDQTVYNAADGVTTAIVQVWDSVTR